MTEIDKIISNLPEDRKEVIQKLRKIINEHIPKGFEETISYGMLSWVVPKSIYPPGYHVKPNPPLPFLSLGSQKGHIGLYHMGIYADKELYEWFISEYPKYVDSKLDIGKSCIRFKKMEEIPYELVGKLVTKMTPKDWIQKYEKELKN